MSDAASRAAARKAKILARGNTGLAKLAQSARGDEAQALYADDFKPSPSSTPTTEAPPPIQSSTSTSTSSSRNTNSTWPPEPNTSVPQNRATQSQGNPNLTAEQQAMSAQLEAMMSMFGGGGGQGNSNGEMPDMSKLLSQMMGGGIGPGGLGGDSQRLLGDLDDPAGLGGFPMNDNLGGIPPNLFGNGSDNQDIPFPFPSMGGLGGFGVSQKKSKSEKYFPLIHFLSIILLSLFTILWWEPKIKSETSLINAIEGNWSSRWSSLNGKSFGKFGNVEIVPIFWAWTTLELILQTSRFMIFKSPPPPHSLISNFLPLLPPKISKPIITGSRYLSLLSQTYKDGCLLVFTLGMTVVLSQFLNGGKLF
ncbi:uncharacterized protein I206_101513 [Kwoniella pini CBS 10737]|uniref:Golgi to ER traffic protein 2 n=1 Tax=Kwoniella pini CBS 10737 TaxID=1296096 RepID=A0A1B9HWG6_9TREE|nr:uncharacterized protein I206_06515 [Kwoniella pini CBS 10737]OCF47612.1 hypothetical protein I206_06515 [Kwoniella pini CBS 10737]